VYPLRSTERNLGSSRLCNRWFLYEQGVGRNLLIQT
jgi:hypothetical protein